MKWCAGRPLSNVIYRRDNYDDSNKQTIINNIQVITSSSNHLAKDLLCSFSSNAIFLPGFFLFKTSLCRLKQINVFDYYI
jgi:hypothetical protein